MAGASAARSVSHLYYPKNEQPGSHVLHPFHVVICQGTSCQGQGETICSLLKQFMCWNTGAWVERKCGYLASFYFKAENLVLRARSESVGFAEIVNKDRMVGTKAQSKNQKTILNNKLK